MVLRRVLGYLFKRVDASDPKLKPLSSEVLNCTRKAVRDLASAREFNTLERCLCCFIGRENALVGQVQTYDNQDSSRYLRK